MLITPTIKQNSTLTGVLSKNKQTNFNARNTTTPQHNWAITFREEDVLAQQKRNPFYKYEVDQNKKHISFLTSYCQSGL